MMTQILTSGEFVLDELPAVWKACCELSLGILPYPLL